MTISMFMFQVLHRSEKKQCYLVLGLVWQLIRMHLFRQININEVSMRAPAPGVGGYDQHQQG